MDKSGLQNKINRLSDVYAKKQSASALAALSLRHYQAYYATGEKGWLQQAYDIVHAALTKNEGGLFLYYLNMFYTLELGGLDKGKELLENMKPYRNHFKANNPFDYGALLFFQGLYESEKERFFVRKKGLTQLLAYNDEKDVKDLDVLIAALFVRYGEYDRAAEYAAYAYERGSRSAALYMILGEIFNNAETLYEPLNPTVCAFLRWAGANGIDVTFFIDNHAHALMQFFDIDFEVFADIYKNLKIDSLLSSLCQYYISQGDVSSRAFQL